MATKTIVHMQRLVLCFFFLLFSFQLEVLHYDCLCHLLRHLMADILLYTQSTPSDLKLSLTCKASDKHWLDKFVYCWNTTASIVVGLTIPVGVCRKPCSISSLLRELSKDTGVPSQWYTQKSTIENSAFEVCMWRWRRKIVFRKWFSWLDIHENVSIWPRPAVI